MPRKREYPGSIRRKGNRWEIRLTVAGERHEFTCTGSLVQAKQMANDKANELKRRHERIGAGLPGDLRFGQLLDRYRETDLKGQSEGGQRSYENSFLIFEKFFVGSLNDPVVHDIRRGHIKEFFAWRAVNRFDGRGDRPSAHTIARDRRTLHRLFNYAMELEIVEANPVHNTRTAKPDERAPALLTPAEFERLLEACDTGRGGPDPMLRLFVLLCGETGVRSVSEALRLRWEDIDLAGGFVRVTSRPGARTKAGKTRYVPLTARVTTALGDHAATYRMAVYDGHRSAYVFHHLKTHRRVKAGTPYRGMYHAVQRAMRRARLPYIGSFRVHDLRHRRVTTWLAEGKSAVLVKEAVGHAALHTTMGYTHLAKEHLRALVAEPELRKAHNP